MQHMRSVTWLSCSCTASNDKSLLQKVTKVHLKVVKKSKIQKSTDYPTNYTETPSLTTKGYKNEFIFWFAKTWQNFEFLEKAHEEIDPINFSKNW